MPVSPQDFAIWSDLTGNPYPRTPAERMALAPEVYQFTRGIGRRGGYGMSPVRKAVDIIGKTALAAGAIAGAAYLGSGGFKKLQLDDEPDVSPPVDSTGPTDSVVPVRVVDMSPQTTAENYNQNFLPLQTRIAGLLRGVSPAKPTVVDSEEKPATQSHVIASSQTFSPGSELEQLTKSEVPHTPVRDRADELVAEFLGGVAAEERQQKQIEKSIDIHNAGIIGKMQPVLKQLHKAGLEEGVTLAGRGETRAAEAFRQTPQYAEMMKSAGASMEPEELIGAPSQPVTFTQVRATPVTRISGAEPAPKESAIVEMVAPKVESPAPQATVEVAAPVAVTAPARRSAESDAKEQMERKYLGLNPRTQASPTTETIVTSQPPTVRVSETGAPTAPPTSKAFLVSKVSGRIPGATSRGSAEQALAEAAEIYEGQLNPPKGTIHGSPEGGSSFIEHARLYPNNMMGIKVKGQGVEYVHKVDPGFVPYAAEMIKSGDFYGQDYNEMKRIGVLQPHIGSEDLPRNAAARASFISQERARLGL